MNRNFMKITGVFLALILSLSSVFVAAAPDGGSAVDEGLNEAMEVLRLFSIIPDYYDYSVDETENVARADFASGVAKMIGLTTYDGDAFYYDVPENHWAFAEISALTQQGILNGVGNKLFRPDDIITKGEAYKMLMTILGYGEWAEYNGGYPAGYASAANRARVSDGVSSNENVTVSDMITMFYNAICASVLEPTSYGTESASYSAEEGNTLLSIYRNIYYREGVMTGANQISFSGEALEDGEVMIDDTVYESDVDGDISQYLGEEVKLFYHYSAKDDKRTILWTKPMYDDNVLCITADNDTSFEKETYVLNYMDGDKKKTVSIDRSGIFVYNGNILKEGISDVLNKAEYTIKLVKDNDGKYSTAIIKAFENYVVGSIDSTDMVIYDKANNNRALSLNANNYERLKLSVLGKTPVTVEEVKVNDVLSVYLSADKKYMDIHVSVDNASGTIDSMRTTSEGIFALVNAVEYFIPKTAKGDSVKAGQNVKFYLDATGEVAYIETDTTAYTPIYLIDAVKSDNIFSSSLRFRALTRQGKVQALDCDDTVKIDGKVYKDTGKAIDYMIPGGNFTPQFAMVRINNEGKITMLDTAIDNPDATDDDVLQVSVPLQGSVVCRNKSLGHKAVLDGNTIIFSLPEELEGAEDKEFAVLSALTDWKTYSNVETYKVQNRVGYEQFVVVSGHNASMYWESDVPVLVKSFSEVLGDEGDIREALVAYQGTTEKEFPVEEGLSLIERGVEKGDVIRLKLNGDGTIDDFTMIYDYDKGEENAVIGGYGSQLAFSVGYITDVVDGVIKIGKTPGATDISIYTASVPCVFYDSSLNDNEIYVGDIAGAKTYFNEDDDCSMVVITQSYTVPKSLIVFK